MRIIFDISSFTRRFGPTGGVGRTEREFTRYVVTSAPDVTLGFYDPLLGQFREARREWVAEIVGGSAIVDLSHLPIRADDRATRRRNWPTLLRQVAFRIERPRYHFQLALERMRLSGRSSFTRRMSEKLLVPMRSASSRYARSGLAPAVLPFDIVMGEPIELGSDCVLASAGNEWSHSGTRLLRDLKERHGFRYVGICHDLIVLQFPELASDRVYARVKSYWESIIPMCELIVVTSKTVAGDVRAYCAARNLPLPALTVVPLGTASPALKPQPGLALPPGLQPGKFVLMVGTLDPRKGHEFLIRVWKRLVAAGIPQAQDFRMVFVGKSAPNTPPDLTEMLLKQEAGPTLLHLSSVSDDQLAALYRDAAFCVLPSKYEGYGLPIVEAFAAGKALIASTGGSIPEVVDGLAPCLDPDDEDAWFEALKQWIVEPDVRSAYEEKVRKDFRPRSWDEAAREFFQAVRSVGIEAEVPVSGAVRDHAI
jgi:glycosyltransferase involved in cell wall biosynthesis